MRLARYKYFRAEKKFGPFTEYEAVSVFNRACLPYASVKLLHKLWAKKHVVFNDKSGEIVSKPVMPESLMKVHTV